MNEHSSCLSLDLAPLKMFINYWIIFIIVLVTCIHCQDEFPTVDAVITHYNRKKVDKSNDNAHKISPQYSCGLDTIHDKIDHTWLARLKYDSEEFGCGGALITNRYVLTAASCVSGEVVDKLGNVKSVSLRRNYGDRVFIEYRIEKILEHSNYIPNAVHGQNDVALIRLARTVNRYVSTQVCLDFYPSHEILDDLFVEGWGQTLDGQLINKRELLQIQFLNSSTCQNRLSQYTLTDADLCTIGRDSDKACPVDGGGVLLSEKNSKWVLVGIASYDPVCGNSKTPGIFTRFQNIYEWIVTNMNP